MSKSIFLLCIIASSSVAFSQRTDEDGRYYIPNCLFDPISQDRLQAIQEFDFSKEDNSKSGQTWIVYSDKEDNILYREPKLGTARNWTLGFHRPFYVVGAQPSGWLNLADMNGVRIGWVKASELVLTIHPLQNKNKNSRKVMILPSIDNALSSEIPNPKNFQFKAVQNRPDKQKSSFITESKKLSIYFVLKESNGFVLLGKTDNITKQNNIFGWVIKEYITPWDHRIGYGPSYGFDGQAHANRSIPIFLRETDLYTYIEAGCPKNPGDLSAQEIRTTESHSPPPAIRGKMPEIRITAPNHKGQLNLVTIANIDQSSEQDSARAQLNIIKQRIAKLNIVFIVDATQSMSPYLSGISKAIKDIVNSGKVIAPNSQVNFGALVYRDYEDGNNAFQELPLTSDALSFSQKLNAIQCMSRDNDLPEAQYHGIIRGLPLLNLNPRESNLVILIGDAGNKPDAAGNYKNLNEVIELLQKYQANFISFQTHNRPTYTYQKFRDDCMTIISALADNDFDYRLEKTKKSEYYDVEYTLKPGSVESDNTFSFFGATSFPLGNTTTTPAPTLRKMVQEVTGEFFQNVNDKVGKINDVEVGAPMNPKFFTMLQLQGFNPKYLDVLKNIGDFSFRAHAIRKVPGVPEHCLTPYVFMTDGELLERTKQFEKLGRHLSGKEFKKKFEKELVALAANFLGEFDENGEVSERTTTKIKARSIGDIWEDVFNMEFAFQRLGGIPLGDLIQINDDDDLEGDIEAFLGQMKQFKHNDFQKASYRFKLPGTTSEICYWIPMAKFPGSRPD